MKKNLNLMMRLALAALAGGGKRPSFGDVKQRARVIQQGPWVEGYARSRAARERRARWEIGVVQGYEEKLRSVERGKNTAAGIPVWFVTGKKEGGAA
jgi:hypothetical protein